MTETAIRDLLLANNAVKAIVGTRVYPGKLPQRPELPAIRYFRVSGGRPVSHSGGSGLDGARVQFDCLAGTYQAAKALGSALRAVLQGYKGTVGSVVIQACFFMDDSDDYGPESETWRYRADFRIWSEED